MAADKKPTVSFEPQRCSAVVAVTHGGTIGDEKQDRETDSSMRRVAALDDDVLHFADAVLASMSRGGTILL